MTWPPGSGATWVTSRSPKLPYWPATMSSVKSSVDYFEKNRNMLFWMVLFFGKSKCFVGRFIGGWNKNAAKRFMLQGHAISFAGVSQPLPHNCSRNQCASEGSAGGAAREGGSIFVYACFISTHPGPALAFCVCCLV